MFLDLELGDQSPAMLYWDQFVRLTRDKGFWGLHSRFRYLACMEPLPSVQMYVDAWAAATHDPGTSAWNGLAESRTEKRLAVLEAWISRVETVVADPTQAKQPWMKQPTLKDELLPRLKRQAKWLRTELATTR